MNIERMHAIFIAIRDELKADNTVAVFQELINSLQNQINEPQEPKHQQQVSAHLENLKDKLGKSLSNEFSPAWRMMLDELDFTDYLGSSLLNKVEEIFSRNQITPVIALNELNEIFPKLKAISDSLDQVLTGFSSLKISHEELGAGECEIGVLIPRTAIENKIDNLSKELKEISLMFGTFEEIATGQRSGLELRSISTSDPAFFFDSLPAVAAFTTVAIERVVAIYKSLLEVKKLRMELKTHGVAGKDLKGIERHVNEVIEKGIDKLIPKLIKEFNVVKDDGRVNELKTSLKISLNKIANRIDKGFNIEVRVEPLGEESDDESKEDRDSKDAKNITLILEKSASLRFIKTSGEPILSLPENDKKS